MTDEQMQRWLAEKPNDRVMVVGRDYVYHGWLVAVFAKRHERAGLRCVVEDKQGRLFIHNAAQLGEPRNPPPGTKPMAKATASASP